jgi:hypothetical protein
VTEPPGVEIQVWRIKPKPDIRVMELVRGGTAARRLLPENG